MDYCNFWFEHDPAQCLAVCSAATVLVLPLLKEKCLRICCELTYWKKIHGSVAECVTLLSERRIRRWHLWQPDISVIAYYSICPEPSAKNATERKPSPWALFIWKIVSGRIINTYADDLSQANEIMVKIHRETVLLSLQHISFLSEVHCWCLLMLHFNVMQFLWIFSCEKCCCM